jgi:hypothetical protein
MCKERTLEDIDVDFSKLDMKDEVGIKRSEKEATKILKLILYPKYQKRKKK